MPGDDEQHFTHLHPADLLKEEARLRAAAASGQPAHIDPGPAIDPAAFQPTRQPDPEALRPLSAGSNNAQQPTPANQGVKQTDPLAQMYAHLLERMEPGVTGVDPALCWASMAISLKRIADAFEEWNHQKI